MQSPETILRLPAVKQRTGLGRAYIYLLMSRGQFPVQIKLGPNIVGWVESEISEWIASRIADSRTPQPKQAATLRRGKLP